MTRSVNLLSLGAFTLLLAGCADNTGPTAPSAVALPRSGVAILQSSGAPDFQATDHFIVKYSGSNMPDEAKKLIAAAGGRMHREWPEIGYGIVGGIGGEAAGRLRGVVGITGVTQDVVLRWIPVVDQSRLQTLTAPTTQTDQHGAFFFTQFQWYLRQIDADQAWLTTDQGAGEKVAILDTGTDPGHLDLAPNPPRAGRIDLAKSRSVLSSTSPCGVADQNTINDLNFHGTAVSALVASQGIGMGSTAPDASLIAVKVLNCRGFGSFGDVITGIVYATNAGANVINMSLGALIGRKLPGARELIDAVQDAVDFAARKGVMVVAAAGNDALNFDDLPDALEQAGVIHIPSMLNHVLSVGATAPIGQMNFDTPTSYTNFGKRGVDVMAPGGDLVPGGQLEDLILSACSEFVCGVTNAYVLAAGTSFSSPLAAGTAAVALSEGQNPEKCIIAGADRITGRGNDELFGRGRINVLGAARCRRLERRESGTSLH